MMLSFTSTSIRTEREVLSGNHRHAIFTICFGKMDHHLLVCLDGNPPSHIVSADGEFPLPSID